jgi:hypothetical protein
MRTHRKRMQVAKKAATTAVATPAITGTGKSLLDDLPPAAVFDAGDAASR